MMNCPTFPGPPRVAGVVRLLGGHDTMGAQVWGKHMGTLEMGGLWQWRLGCRVINTLSVDHRGNRRWGMKMVDGALPVHENSHGIVNIDDAWPSWPASLPFSKSQVNPVRWEASPSFEFCECWGEVGVSGQLLVLPNEKVGSDHFRLETDSFWWFSFEQNCTKEPEWTLSSKKTKPCHQASLQTIFLLPRILRVARAARIINSLPELRVLVKGMASLCCVWFETKSVRICMWGTHTYIYIYYICTCTFFNISIRYIHTDSMVNVLHTPMKRIHALIYIYRTLRTLPSFAMLGSEGLEWATNNPWTNVCLIEGYPVNCCKHGTSQNRQQTDLFRGWHYLVYI